jgi:leucyl-tRNA synthetase
MSRYSPKEIEPKWQKIWEDSKIHQASDSSDKPKKYILEYFPYPSGSAMHVGHVRNYTIGDAMSRFYRMSGYNVLHPMGWDAFGLPAENYAIKNKISPRKAIDENTTRFKQQLMQMGFGYDWSREIDSTDPQYYKWTQWFFLLLYNKGLAYQQESLQWWCPHDKTVLANEQVEAGKCWRCGNQVEKKALKQWFFKITDYADRLLEDLDDLDWSEAIKSMQRNWIGKSVGAEIVFKVDSCDEPIKVFTTRPDTLFGATFLVMAPEHPLISKITTESQKNEVEDYSKLAQAKTEIDRMDESREKTGVFTGTYATNPVNNEKIPIWVADYVLYGYGTGAIMAVPAHDERDWEFAKKFDLNIVHTYDQEGAKPDSWYNGEGIIKNSGIYNGSTTNEMRDKVVADLAEKKLAVEKVNYKIHDWLISRQRYWGAPIPMIHCASCGVVPVPENQLPVELPELDDYSPSGDGKSPLAKSKNWLEVDCPKCGGMAERETDTMDGFACSSWYFLRFADPQNDKQAFSNVLAKYWLPVDDYIGGAEHAVMHLLYARFWTKVMFDEGLINFTEPFKSLRNHGMILAPDGQKMSKSKNNSIEPGGLIADGYGADTVRVMELFIGPWDQAVNWSVDGVGGCYRFLNRVWTLCQEYQEVVDKNSSDENIELKKLSHRTIKKVTKDLHEMGFNTAISAMMEMTNELYKIKAAGGYRSSNWPESLKLLLLLLAPFAPHISEELWHQLGMTESVHTSNWPQWDDMLTKDDLVTIAVQINGKVKAELQISVDAEEEEATKQAQHSIKEQLSGQEIKKTVYVKGRIINFVV